MNTLKPMTEAPTDGTVILILCDDNNFYAGAWHGEVYPGFSIIKGFGFDYDGRGYPDSAVRFDSVWVDGDNMIYKKPIAKAWTPMPKMEDFKCS